MKHIATLAALTVSGLLNGPLFGQTSWTTLDLNHASGIINNNGTFFNDIANQLQGYEVPKDSGVHAIYYMNFVAAGQDINNQISGAFASYDDSDWKPGPVAGNYNDPEYQTKYSNSLWNISRTVIEYHIANWNTQGYTPDPALVNWPAHGNTANGEAHYLAPFHDSNNDGVYNPMDGDYPEIRGDKAVFCIINDDQLHPSGSNPVKMEAHLMFYQYTGYDEALGYTVPYIANTTFIHAALFNRGTSTLYDFHVGSVIDFDLGNFADDYIGTDIGTDMAYVYNGDLFDDQNSGIPGYGEHPPALGVKALNNNLYSHVPMEGAPSGPLSSYINQLRGLRPDSSPYLDGSNQPTTYIYSETGEGNWNEPGLNHGAGDRRSIISFEPATFIPGSVHCYDFAVVYARDENSSTLFDAVDTLIIVADAVQDFYDQQDFICYGQVLETAGNEEVTFSLAPNPATTTLTISGTSETRYVILSTDGRIILQGQLDETAISIEELPAGYYLFRTANSSQTVSFIKQ